MPEEKTMDELLFAHKLNEIVSEFGSIPAPEKEKLVILARKSQESHQKLKQSMEQLQSSLDYLRVSVKYILFDLEATRRENKQLRKLLEEKNQE
jgi:hypothetical protein